MSELSIFVDESGDFGKLDNSSPYYLVTLIFHDRSFDISEALSKLDESLLYLDRSFPTYIHTGPIIRREPPYSGMNIDERRRLIYKMRSFFLHAPIFHTTIIVNKKEHTGALSIGAQISKQLKALIDRRSDFFSGFDKITVYYDNGQMELNTVLNSALNAMLFNVEFEKASPIENRLLQTADFVCSMKLLEIKQSEKRLSQSEINFFYKPQELKKSFFKAIKTKEL